MEDREDRLGNDQHFRSYMDEIRAHDIYTIRSSNICPTIPSICTSIYGKSPSSDHQYPMDRGSSFFGKSNSRYRSVMKKLSLQQTKRYLVSLPALLEEDNSSSSPIRELPSGGTSRTEFKKNEALRYYAGIDDAELLSSGIYESVDRHSYPGHFDESASQSLARVDSDKDYDSSVSSDNDDIEDDDDDSSLEVLDDESWVDLTKHTTPEPAPAPSFSQAFSSAPSGSVMSHGFTSPDRVTPPPFGNGEEYIRLLREAQKESNQSSARVSLASSRRDTPRDSPKSPPNSPNTEMVLETEEMPLKGVYINYYNRDGDFVRVEKNVETDWIWDWSSRPDQTPPKEWKFVHPGKRGGRGASIRRLMVGNSSLFSRDVLYTLLITNVLSLLLGTGIGIWLSKKTGGGSGAMSLTTMPIN